MLLPALPVHSFDVNDPALADLPENRRAGAMTNIDVAELMTQFATLIVLAKCWGIIDRQPQRRKPWDARD